MNDGRIPERNACVWCSQRFLSDFLSKTAKCANEFRILESGGLVHLVFFWILGFQENMIADTAAASSAVILTRRAVRPVCQAAAGVHHPTTS